MVDVSFGPATLVPAHDIPALELLHFVTATIPKKLASIFMKALSGTLPLTDFGHVKRIRKAGGESGAKAPPDCLEIILCVAPAEYQPPQLSMPLPPGMAPEDNSQSAPPPTKLHGLPDLVNRLAHEHSLETRLVAVPRRPPQTREQWREWGALWPLSWRVPENPPPDKDLSEEDALYFRTHMAEALQLTAQASLGPCDNAAIFVDPVSGSVVGQGCDGSSTHPLDHPVLLAIKAVAKRDWDLWPEPTPAASSRGHGGGSSDTAAAASIGDVPNAQSANLEASEAGRENELVHASILDGGEGQCEEMGHPFRPVTWGVESLDHLSGAGGEDQSTVEQSDVGQGPSSLQQAADVGGDSDARGCRPSSAGESGSGSSGMRKRGRTATSAAYAEASKRRSESGDAVQGGLGSTSSEGGAAAAATATIPASRGRPYMCTGYDCFVVREPCVMCAMALVHSRVARVVYCDADPLQGALGGSFKLHSQKSINHHYKVYHMPKG